MTPVEHKLIMDLEFKLCEKYRISYNDLHSGSHKMEIMNVKKIVQHFQRKVLKWKLVKIGEYWGVKHSSVRTNIISAVDLKLVGNGYFINL